MDQTQRLAYVSARLDEAKEELSKWAPHLASVANAHALIHEGQRVLLGEAPTEVTLN